MTSRNDIALNKKSKLPWYAYGVGGAIYAALAGWLLTESSPLALICLLSAPVGVFYAWKVWEHETQHRDEA